MATLLKAGEERPGLVVILLENKTQLDLQVGQLGCEDCVDLPSGSSVTYRWASAAGTTSTVRRLLQARLECAIDKQPDVSSADSSPRWLAERHISHPHASTSRDGGRGTAAPNC